MPLPRPRRGCGLPADGGARRHERPQGRAGVRCHAGAAGYDPAYAAQQRNIRSARERVRHYLALNAGADGRSVALTGTLKEAAAELGLTHEAFYRTLAALERAGEIKRAGAKISDAPAPCMTRII